MRQDKKEKIFKEIEELRLNYSDVIYQKTLKKILNSNDAELIYIFKKKIGDAPIEILANEIMKKDQNLLNDIKNNIWRIKFAKDFGNIDLNRLWLFLYNIYHNKEACERCGVKVDMEELNNNLLLLSSIDNAPVDEIYDFLRDRVGNNSQLMKEFLNLDINLNLNLDLIINQFSNLDVYNGDNPKEIYYFVYNYYRNISSEKMDQIVSILFRKLQDYYYLGHSDYYGNQALDTLILFLTDIKSLTIEQKRNLVKKSLQRVKCDISINEEHSKVIQSYENVKQAEKMSVENYAQALRYCLPPHPPRNQDF